MANEPGNNEERDDRERLHISGQRPQSPASTHDEVSVLGSHYSRYFVHVI